jgi:streptogramin lyase
MTKESRQAPRAPLARRSCVSQSPLPRPPLQIAAIVVRVCMAVCLVGLIGSVAPAFGDDPSSGDPSQSSLFEGPLVGASGLDEDQQVLAAEEAVRSSPEAVANREASRTEFDGLNAEQAAQVAAEEFPAVVTEPGGIPSLPPGQRITSYLSANAASVDVGHGQQALLESSAPIAVQASSGETVPVDLDLHDDGSSLSPTTPVVAVSIPKQLSDGVALAGLGVSLTPVDDKGMPLSGSKGAVDGAAVLYANTLTDTDTLVKPTAGGFEADTFLRSPASPGHLYFRVDASAGATLVQAENGAGPVQIVEEGLVIATVLPPSAQDAAGTSVPVTMTLSGHTLALAADDSSQEYRYPIDVDPEVLGTDTQMTTSGTKRTNWEFFSNNGKGEPSANFGHSEAGGVLSTFGAHEYKEGEAASWVYQTRGVSKIYEFTAETEASNKEDRIESIVELQHEGAITEEKELLSNETKGPVEYTRKPLPEPLCPKGKESCVPTSGNKENAVHFQQSVVNKPTSKFNFSDGIAAGTVYISEPEKTHSTTSYNTTTPEFEVEVENSKHETEKQKRVNVLAGTNSWLSEFRGAIQVLAKDPGIGVSSSRFEFENAGKWEFLAGSEHNYLEQSLCKGIQCPAEQTEDWTLNPHLPNGADKIRYRAEEAFGDATHETESLTTEGATTVKVDAAKPHGIFINGLPYGNELSEKSYELTAFGADGEGTTVPSSGVESLTLFVDGKSIKSVGTGEGKCTTAKGECTATAKYKIQGSELGAGQHAIVVVAKDNAGNEARVEETISIRHSTPVVVGPGSVDLQSGDFALPHTDVSLGSGLSVARTYSSRDVTAGGEGSLGPQWSMSLGAEETLTEMPDASVLVTSGNGDQTIFAAVLNTSGEPTGEFESPPADSNLALTLSQNAKHEKLAYFLTDPAAGTSTKFALAGTAKVWVPTEQEGPAATDTVSYLYQTVEIGGHKITRPTEERAATPAKVSCAPKLEPGCRALKFTYAEKPASEPGEGPTEWGEYEGRLSKVSYVGYNPSTKKMLEPGIPVAEYAYDKQGRLRAEWDPRISPALKTEYGYDSEGHVTALSAPGQEPWMFAYGMTPTDAGAGRLLKVTRAPATAALWTGSALKNTTAPAITGKAIVNVKLAVSTGTWSGSPLAYSYQWDDCSSTESCKPIPEANNPNYTPKASDSGFKLGAVVSATNGGGTLATTVFTAPVLAYEQAGYSPTGEHSLTSFTLGPDGNFWYTDKVNVVLEPKGKVGKITPAGAVTEYAVKANYPEGITTGPANKDVWFAEYTRSVGDLTTEGALTRYKIFGPVRQFAFTSITAGPSGENNLWVTDDEKETETGEFVKPSIVKITNKGLKSAQYTVPSGNPKQITVGPDNNLWFVAPGFSEAEGSGETPRIDKVTPAGVITQYSLPKGSNPTDIVSGPNGHLWFTEAGTNKVGQITTAGAITEYALPEGSNPKAIGKGPEETLWVTEPGTLKMARLNSSGVVLYEGTSFGGTLEVLEGPEKNMWSLSSGGITKTTVKPAEAAAVAPTPGTTIDYNVPVSGAGAPHNMSTAEIAKWGQTAEEAPAEATAITPSDSPQGWPASSYARSSVYYLDESGRLVNTGAPSTGTYGAISTTEYNEYNDVVRTLSADNRATAMAVGEAKSPEVASLLSSFDTYHTKCSKESEFNEERESEEPGTRLCATEGPAHAVKYVAGKEQKEAPYAREHVRFFYDEKVPTEGPKKESFASQTFNLITESRSLTEIVNAKGGVEEEVEPRTDITSYSGQANLGWKLREPTSVTAAAETEGAKVTHTTLYNENGQVTETRGPEGAAGNSTHDQKTIYYTQEENTEAPTCGKHAEWAGLVCEMLPGKQPEGTGVPKLPITTTTYNLWNEPETVVETIGEKTRTTKNEYDSAGRLIGSEETSTATTEAVDKALPKVNEEYNTTLGGIAKQSTTAGGKTQTITSAYNTLGEVETYSDSAGGVAKFKYAGPENDGLLEEMSDNTGDGANTQTYTYDETTKQLTKLVDSSAGTFTATYDPEGLLTNEVYPNAMCAKYTSNSVNVTTHVEYLNTANCSEKEPGVWFTETELPSARGEALSRASTLANEEYGYDTLGRLTEVHETPAGEFCKTRLYAYDEESNRTELKVREPNTKKECATEGGTTEKHTYDEANRLSDAGIAYDALENITKLPAADAEGHALESSFYVDNAVATQEQENAAKEKIREQYFLDPDGRVRETLAGSRKVISHYDAWGATVVGTCEGAETAEACEGAGKWTRNIPGIDGTLTAVQTGTGATGETPVLQLHDLEGDVVATIKDKAGETALASKYNSTEFGVPNGGKEAPKFAWLGADGVEKTLASGVITEGATSYVPQTGLPLQSEAVAPPGLPDGSGGTAASFTASPWNMQGIERVGAEAPGREAGREREAYEEAVAECFRDGQCATHESEGGGGPTPTTESSGGGGAVIAKVKVLKHPACGTVTRHRNAEGATGNILVTFLMSIEFCWNNKVITSVGMHHAWGEAHLVEWEYLGLLGQDSTGGKGTDRFKMWAQGNFCVNLIKFGCVQHWQPTLEVRVFQDGEYESEPG